MHVVIAKVDETLFDGEAESLTVPGAAGEMTVLDHHEPLITRLKSGTAIVRLRGDTKPHMFAIDGGVLEVRTDGATVLL